MRLLSQIFDSKVKDNPRPYFLQASLAFLVLFVVLLVEELGLHLVILAAAIGSTTFVLFVTPHSPMASARHVIGGHILSLSIGSVFAFYGGPSVAQDILGQSSLLINVQAALAVGISIFIMAATNTEHAPAAGTALGVVVHGLSWELVLFVASSAVMLSMIHWVLRSRLQNLL